MSLTKIPTCIKTFDANIDYGFPAGSVILLLEDVGAGAREFMYTSLFNSIKLKSNGDAPLNRINKDHNADEIPTTLVLPENLCYISVSRTKDDVLNEIAYAFHKDFYETLKKNVTFIELHDSYFRRSIAKNFWTKGDQSDFDSDLSDKNLIDDIFDVITKHTTRSVVVFDSLTELMLYEDDYILKNDIIMFLKGLVKVSKKWNGIIYLILCTNILEPHLQELITDLVDGVLVFSWIDKKSIKMQRSLHISKFRGLLPKVEQNNIEKFETKITSSYGFEVSNIRKIV